MPVKVAEEWLNICGGCEVTILDIGEPLLDLLPKLEFVHMPVLMDHKYFGQTGEKTEMEIPEADVGIISGGIRNEKICFFFAGCFYCKRRFNYSRMREEIKSC